ncbi:MAG: flagellar protein FlgN [Lachnospiraceae bacterium]|nr:flagellar protein FlgN [Lachnospiraceae bacterium]
MASLVDDLAAVLQQEMDIYQKLIPVSEQKTEILIRGDLKQLQEVTEQEQKLLDDATASAHHREQVIANMGMVLNRDPKELDLSGLITLLAKQPEEKKRLANLHDELRKTMHRLVDVNEKNKNLIENSLEMIEFNMNFIQSTRMSPGNNNYNKNASAAGSMDSGYSAGSFDAKQ